MNVPKFFTKDHKVRPITKRRASAHTLQTGTAHLNVPRKPLIPPFKTPSSWRFLKRGSTGSSYYFRNKKTGQEVACYKSAGGEYLLVKDFPQMKDIDRFPSFEQLLKGTESYLQPHPMPSVQHEIKEEHQGEADYLKKAEAFAKAGDPVAADELQRIARTEGEHEKILKAIEQDRKQGGKRPSEHKSGFYRGDKIRVDATKKVGWIKDISPSGEYVLVESKSGRAGGWFHFSDVSGA